MAMKLVRAGKRLEFCNSPKQVVDGHIESVGEKMEVVEGRFPSPSFEMRDGRWLQTCSAGQLLLIQASVLASRTQALGENL